MQPDQQQTGHLVGVDIGATKILAGAFTRSLELVGSAKVSTKAQRGEDAVMGRIIRAIREAVDEADLTWDHVTGVGIGVPGVVNDVSGEVVFAPNLGWRNIQLKGRLEQQLGKPCRIENDGNLAALGVHRVEYKSAPKSLLGVFVGTGIGGGIIQDGKLVRGIGHAAGEVGHMIIDVEGPRCSCGNNGCLEALASRTAMLHRIQEAVSNGQKTVLTDLVGSNLASLRSGDLRRAIRRGDPIVERVVKDAARYLGLAIANLAHVLNPEIIVLGGGIMVGLEVEMFSIVNETARSCALPGALTQTEIKVTRLGDRAGILGGAVLAAQPPAA
jgi:glucokinase